VKYKYGGFHESTPLPTEISRPLGLSSNFPQLFVVAMMNRFICLVFVVACLSTALAQSAGCGANPPSSGTKSITVNGQMRQYILDVPANYDPTKPHRLIFGYHWLNGNMNAVAPGFYGLKNLAADSTVFIAPNGINSGWANTNNQDIAFTDAIVDTVTRELCIDESQVFATGFSYGGAMSYALACSRAGMW
jgi:poly(3-hydroxybutyrate) depolymerase